MEIKIYMLNGNSHEIQEHYSQKEYRDDIIVEIDKQFYELYFYTPDRAVDELIDMNFFSMPGLVIVSEVSDSIIINSITYLFGTGYFSKLNSYADLPIANRFIDKYYKNELSFDVNNLVTISLLI